MTEPSGPERKSELKEIFLEASNLAREQREAFLDSRCAGSPAQRASRNASRCSRARLLASRKISFSSDLRSGPDGSVITFFHCSARNSHARANCQSRLTVRSET